MRDATYRCAARVATATCRLAAIRLDVQGIGNLPAAGGVVLAVTHLSFLAFVFVGLAYDRRARRPVRFLAKRSLFDHRLTGPLLRAAGQIPVDRSAGAAAYRAAVDALRAGEVVAVFPEATISRSFVPRRLATGAARMAAEAGVPLIPVVTWGGQRLWTAGRRPRLTRRVPVTVRVDPPLVVVDGEGADDVTGRMACRLAAMVGDVIAAYPDRADGAGAWWMPAHLGGSAPTPQEAATAELRAIGDRASPGAA